MSAAASRSSKTGKRKAKTKSAGRSSRARVRRPRPIPVTSDVFGLRCRVKEVLLLDESLVLVSDVDGAQFALPLRTLTGRDALANIERDDSVWLSVRAERRGRHK